MITKLAKDLYINERIRFDHFFPEAKTFLEYEGRVIDVVCNEDFECIAVHVLSDDGDSVWKEFEFENEIEVVVPWEEKPPILEPHEWGIVYVIVKGYRDEAFGRWKGDSEMVNAKAALNRIVSKIEKELGV